MSETVLARESDVIVRELANLSRDVANAKRVILVGAAHRPRLLAELNLALEPMGIICAEMNVGESANLDYPPALMPQPPRPANSFADLLESPGLSALLGKVPPPTLLLDELPPAARMHLAPELEPEPEPEPEPVPEPEPAPAPVPKPPRLDMTKPENWQFGDIFTENPRFTLSYLRKKWIFKAADADGVELRCQSNEDTELLSIDQFIRGYVFVQRGAQTADE